VGVVITTVNASVVVGAASVVGTAVEVVGGTVTGDTTVEATNVVPVFERGVPAIAIATTAPSAATARASPTTQ
jgi:hypothetical protein